MVARPARRCQSARRTLGWTSPAVCAATAGHDRQQILRPVIDLARQERGVLLACCVTVMSSVTEIIVRWPSDLRASDT